MSKLHTQELKMEQKANKHNHNAEFLLGIFISVIIFQILLIFPFFAILYLFGIVLIGFISGITAGICNENMIRSVLSGLTGVLIGFFIPPFYGVVYLSGFLRYAPIDTPIILYTYFYMILSILFGGLGGIFGNN